MRKNTDTTPLSKRFRNWVEGEDEERQELPPIVSMDELEPAARPREHHSIWQMRDRSRIPAEYWVMAVLVAVTVLAALLYTAVGMPPFDDPNVPTMNEVPQRYVEKCVEETGALNTVAGMILDYRAFDTFGESTVLFAATVSIVFLMRQEDARTRDGKKRSPRSKGGKKRALRPSPAAPDTDVFAGPYTDSVFLGTTRLLIPFIMLFGIYVVMNGHLSPGGGFSGGAILGGGLILCAMVVGQERMRRVLGLDRITKITAFCLLAYAAMKGYSFFTGANHTGWEVPKGTPGDLLSAGFILPLNICVGVIVAGTIFSFYLLFSQEERD